MMKAKEYHKRVAQSEDPITELMAVDRELLEEVLNTAKARQIKRSKALFSLIEEIDQKRDAVWRLMGLDAPQKYSISQFFFDHLMSIGEVTLAGSFLVCAPKRRFVK